MSGPAQTAHTHTRASAENNIKRAHVCKILILISCGSGATQSVLRSSFYFYDIFDKTPIESYRIVIVLRSFRKQWNKNFIVFILIFLSFSILWAAIVNGQDKSDDMIIKTMEPFIGTKIFTSSFPLRFSSENSLISA